MARISTVLCASHTPFLFAPPEEWEPARATRASRGGLASSVPLDSPETNAQKFARCRRAYGVLRDQLERARPDVLVIFGDDQFEQFDFKNFPAFALFVGETLAGFKISRSVGLPVSKNRPVRPKTPEHWATVRTHPALSRALMKGLMRHRFDLAFSVDLPDDEEGVGHAFMRPLYYLDPEYRLPIVPIFVNCYYGPQPTGTRCYELGRAVREVIASLPLDLNVAILGSGGLWHTPNYPNSYLDEAFDGAILQHVRSGDAHGMAAYFDSREAVFDDSDPEGNLASGGTGMLLGLGSGTGETRNWIAAAAVAEGRAGTVVDYVPVYASPCGTAFAYWNLT
jgi:aromatic ring-opening dioxygenase catalytic subunit (LigB family)